MRASSNLAWMRIAALVAASMVCANAALAQASKPDPGADLRTRYIGLRKELEGSSIQRDLYVESDESKDGLRGDTYAVVNYPFATVARTFVKPDSWCQALILHLNVQYCRANNSAHGAALSVAVGKKTDQPLNDTYRINFEFNVAASKPNFLRVELEARKGPLGTRNYLIALELIPLDRKRSFMHFRYAYQQGVMANVATGVYFGSTGHDKVGFTMVEARGNEPRHLVDGVRGALERNTMRYYLAIDAHLHALASPPSQRFEKSLTRWFAATERFAPQLHEVELDDYLTMKRSQYLRQQQPR